MLNESEISRINGLKDFELTKELKRAEKFSKMSDIVAWTIGISIGALFGWFADGISITTAALGAACIYEGMVCCRLQFINHDRVSTLKSRLNSNYGEVIRFPC